MGNWGNRLGEKQQEVIRSNKKQPEVTRSKKTQQKAPRSNKKQQEAAKSNKNQQEATRSNKKHADAWGTGEDRLAGGTGAGLPGEPGGLECITRPFKKRLRTL